MRANALGSAPAAAIESEVRDPGRIVVCAEEMPGDDHRDDQQLAEVRAEHRVAGDRQHAGVVVELLDPVEAEEGDERHATAM